MTLKQWIQTQTNCQDEWLLDWGVKWIRQALREWKLTRRDIKLILSEERPHPVALHVFTRSDLHQKPSWWVVPKQRSLILKTLAGESME